MSEPRSDLATHRVENQPPPRVSDYWASDAPLRQALAAQGGASAPVQAFAGRLAAPEMQASAEAARHHPPELRVFDAGGRRLDEVVFDPGYHALMRAGAEAGYAAISHDGTAGGHVAHAAMVYLLSQVEPGVCCPLTMSHAAIPALGAAPELAEAWIPKLAARAYDPAVRPLAGKRAATLGMAMTEKQGGSDVRANTTRAEPDGDAGGGAWRLTGHKWFCSAPMSDGFLTLAQAEGGLTCFLVPRWLEEGRNTIRLMRLKDKLGNRANASAEIEYDGARAWRVGEEGQGVRAIIRMVHETRLDTAMAPAGLMRAALVHAVHWARHRCAFQRRLIDQPLMRAVLADIALEVEGALALGLRVARAFGGGTEADAGFARIGVALAKYLNNKRAPCMIYEAMEAIGGSGYVEETPMPMLYREAPLNSIWEGSGNVICLDAARTLARDEAASGALEAELDAARGGDAVFDAALEAFRARWPGPPPEAEARAFAERAAQLLTAAVLMDSAPDVAGAYVAARLAGEHGLTAGTARGLDTAPVLERVLPG